MFYLIHWLNENLWDVWADEEANGRIPQELRFEGALGLTQYTDGQSYLGKVLKMSEDKDEVEKAEQELSDLIKSQKTAPVEPRNRKRNTKSRSKSTTVATERQVSSALNERPKLTPAQLEVKKRAAEQLKLKAAAQQKEEDRQDKNLQKSVSRALDFGKSNSDALSDEDIFSNPESDDDVDLEPGNLAVQDNTKKHDNDSLKSSDER
ncbi:uncharacterized protein LOC113215823 isoform X1 [Frankliniella occidentalis]|uniref:Uncharacterized protein LOC113215823 isoform X1 n=1 Tax=Frankliniella occidentalis TaxID=133901 RepID=A0A9C6WZV2_FRAOC|nr:uncharacterized protein LOC113215823 isoform X1 [Frankliniella occidentalis]